MIVDNKTKASPMLPNIISPLPTHTPVSKYKLSAKNHDDQSNNNDVTRQGLDTTTPNAPVKSISERSNLRAVTPYEDDDLLDDNKGNTCKDGIMDINRPRNEELCMIVDDTEEGTNTISKKWRLRPRLQPEPEKDTNIANFDPPEPMVDTNIVADLDPITHNSKKKPFPIKLHDLVSTIAITHPSTIQWTKGGEAFIINKDSMELPTVLKSYFNHDNFRSLHRQLNEYGFKMYTGNGACKGGFYHPHFHRDCGNNQELVLIERISKRTRKRNTSDKKVGESKDITDETRSNTKKAKAIAPIVTKKVKDADNMDLNDDETMELNDEDIMQSNGEDMESLSKFKLYERDFDVSYDSRLFDVQPFLEDTLECPFIHFCSYEESAMEVDLLTTFNTDVSCHSSTKAFNDKTHYKTPEKSSAVEEDIKIENINDAMYIAPDIEIVESKEVKEKNKSSPSVTVLNYKTPEKPPTTVFTGMDVTIENFNGCMFVPGIEPEETNQTSSMNYTTPERPNMGKEGIDIIIENLSDIFLNPIESSNDYESFTLDLNEPAPKLSPIWSTYNISSHSDNLNLIYHSSSEESVSDNRSTVTEDLMCYEVLKLM